ncbi:MFS transporter [Streptomyces coeruleofuscus]|uniref:MFS transporter n=1 Tax=Streptomyces coeruleofuscus TaxID=66879 RepID=A0ABN3J073_9ACTN
MSPMTTRWTVLGGSFLAYMFDALELAILALALPSIREDLGLSLAQGGLLATATLVGIGISSVTLGWIADAYGRKRALLLSLAIFGVFTAALAAAPDLWTFLLLRFLSGLGLGGVWSAVSTYVVESWPSGSRGRAVCFALSSSPVGGLTAAALAAALLPDWRLLFLVSGLGTVLPLVVVGVFFRESEEWLAGRRGAGRREERIRLGQVFSRGLIRPIAVGTLLATCALIGWWGASTWLPTFLGEERGLSVSAVSTFMIVLNLGNFVGCHVFGFLADRHGYRRVLVVSLVGSGVLLAVSATQFSTAPLFLAGAVFGIFTSFFGLFGGFLAGLFPTEVRATGAGFCFNVGRGVSACAPFLLGSLASAGGLGTGLLVCAGFFVLAAATLAGLPRTSSDSGVRTRLGSSPTRA